MVFILDTDPGVDDTLALLLLLNTPRSKADLRLIALTFGNTSLKATLRNVLSLFYVIQEENKYRQSKGLPVVTDQRPIIALGMAHTIDSKSPADAEDVHGNDGLGGIHALNPEYTCPSSWVSLFDPGASKPSAGLPFKIGTTPAWDAILDVLRTEPENTVTIISIGPLSNLAKAAETDPVTFARVKQVLSMGAAIEHPGNVTPLAEFNVYADPVAAARVYALTSKRPAEMLPPGSPASLTQMPRPLELILFPLDLTEKHLLTSVELEAILGQAIKAHPDSLLAKWIKVWLDLSFVNYNRMLGREIPAVQLHDPLTVEYALNPDKAWKYVVRDVRVETGGQWSKGKTLTDNRGRVKLEFDPHDYQKWLTQNSGNNVGVMVHSPHEADFGGYLLRKIITGLT